MLAGYVCGQNFGNKRHLNSHQKSQLIKDPKDFGILGLSAQILGHYENQAKHYSKKRFRKKGKWIECKIALLKRSHIMFVSLYSLLIYFWLHWIFAAARGPSVVVWAGAAVCFFSFFWFLLWWCTSLVAPRHMNFSQTRDWTCVSCIGRRILNPWTTREVLCFSCKGLFLLVLSQTSFHLSLDKYQNRFEASFKSKKNSGKIIVLWSRRRE